MVALLDSVACCGSGERRSKLLAAEVQGAGLLEVEPLAAVNACEHRNKDI